MTWLILGCLEIPSVDDIISKLSNLASNRFLGQEQEAAIFFAKYYKNGLWLT